MEKNCLECGAPVIGRTDKKFCDDACRNTYHNRRNKDCTNLMRNINNALRRNRRILNGLNPEQRSNTTRSKLLNIGFDFKYYTHIYATKKGNIYFFVYDQGYLPLENDYFALVKRE